MHTKLHVMIIAAVKEKPLTMSEMPIMCEPSVLYMSQTHVRLVTFSERIHSL